METEPMDYMLKTLVTVANAVSDEDFYVGITLSVRGIVVSGLLISNVQWMKLNEAQLASSVPATDPEGVPGGGLSQVFAATRDMLSETRTEDEEVSAALNDLIENETLPARYAEFIQQQDQPGYIHLRDAAYYLPGQVGGGLPTNGTLWRGRLSQVDGWSMGNLSTTAS